MVFRSGFFRKTDFIAVILAGGEGSRIGLPFSKCLLPVEEGRPLLLKHINYLHKAGIREWIFVINPAQADILKFIAKETPEDTRYHIVLQPAPIGISEALMRAIPHLQEADNAMILLPDTYMNGENPYEKLKKTHLAQKSPGGVTLCLWSKENNFGSLDFVKTSGTLWTEIDPTLKHDSKGWGWGAIAFSVNSLASKESPLIQKVYRRNEKVIDNMGLLFTEVRKTALKLPYKYCKVKGDRIDCGTIEGFTKAVNYVGQRVGAKGKAAIKKRK